MRQRESKREISREKFDAVLLDLDGVITDTASLHAACWKQVFDEYLRERTARNGETFRPFDLDADYRLYVDGKPRFDGVRSFLVSRGIDLPDGAPTDPLTAETICGLGNHKNALVNEIMAREGVEAYPGSVKAVDFMRQRGYKTAVVSSSENCAAVLAAAGIESRFDVRVDGQTASDLGLLGKPEPDMFLAAARQLAVEPRRAIVVEDAIAGVRAGKQGGFGLVIGVARNGNHDELRSEGASLVVADLEELLPRLS